MDIQSGILYIILAVLCSWIANRKIRQPFFTYLVDLIGLLFLFLATHAFFPDFLGSDEDTISFVDLLLLIAWLLVWLAIRHLFKRTIKSV